MAVVAPSTKATKAGIAKNTIVSDDAFHDDADALEDDDVLDEPLDEVDEEDAQEAAPHEALPEDDLESNSPNFLVGKGIQSVVIEPAITPKAATKGCLDTELPAAFSALEDSIFQDAQVAEA